MKKLLLISLLALLFSSISNAQVTIQISGTVTEVGTGLAVPNHAVYVMTDSTNPAFSYFNTLYTDANGMFQDLVTAPSAMVIPFNFYTSDCNGNGLFQTSIYSGGGPVTANFQVCTGGSTSCTAFFYAIPDSSNPASGIYQFISSSTGNPTMYSWDFGDGTTSTLQNPLHTYAANGTYLVCLTIASATCTDTYCYNVVIGPPPCFNYFSYSFLGMDCTFSGYAASGTGPYTYAWDFGDGSTGVGSSPTHTYAVAGYYTVMLVTTDANACTATSTQYIYAGTPGSIVYGEVTANGLGIDEGEITLFSEDPTTGAWTAVYTTGIDSAGYYFFYNVIPGTYYILAAPTSSSIYFATYAPTYYVNSVFWSTATQIVLGAPANPYDIELAPLAGPAPGGGSISGIITEGAKFTTQGPPVPNIEILLLDMSNQTLDVTYSDAAGQFSFSNLAMGSYKVYAEIGGLPTIPYLVTLTTAAPDNNNVTLVRTPNGITTGITEKPLVAEFSNLSVYPNPAKDVITVAVESGKLTSFTAELFDLTGKRVMMEQLSFSTGKISHQLQLNDLFPGVYTLSLTSENGTKTVQKLTIMR